MVRVFAALATGALCAALTVAWRRRPPVRHRRGVPELLAQGGAPFGPSAYLALRAACALVAGALAYQVTGAAAVAVPPALVAAAAPRWVLARRAAERRAALRQAWPEGLRELAASVSAGMSLPQAVESLAATGPEAIRAICARVPALLPALGLPATLERVRTQAADATTDRVVEVLLLAHERGGRVLPTLLGDLAEAAAQDVHLQERLTTAHMELRINARVVFALPWAVLCVLTARPGPFRDYYASARALPVVALAALLSFAGIALVERLARLPLEPRVFPGKGGAS